MHMSVRMPTYVCVSLCVPSLCRRASVRFLVQVHLCPHACAGARRRACSRGVDPCTRGQGAGAVCVSAGCDLVDPRSRPGEPVRPAMRPGACAKSRCARVGRCTCAPMCAGPEHRRVWAWVLWGRWWCAPG